MAVLMEKFDLSHGDAVADNVGDYGFITRTPYTHPKYGTVADVKFVDTWEPDSEGTWQVFPQYLTQTSGCECGNPFALCHPEA